MSHENFCCRSGKACHATRIDATRALKRLGFNGGAYHCPHCNHWHHSSTKPDQYQARKRTLTKLYQQREHGDRP